MRGWHARAWLILLSYLALKLMEKHALIRSVKFILVDQKPNYSLSLIFIAKCESQIGAFFVLLVLLSMHFNVHSRQRCSMELTGDSA